MQGLEPVFPVGRYGRRRDPTYQRRQRWLGVALAIAGVLVGLLIAGKLYRQYAQPPYQVKIISVTDVTDSGVTITFEVDTPAGAAAACTLLAHTRQGREVGRAEIIVPAGAPDATIRRVTYTLATTGRPVTGEVAGCGPVRSPLPISPDE